MDIIIVQKWKEIVHMVSDVIELLIFVRDNKIMTKPVLSTIIFLFICAMQNLHGQQIRSFDVSDGLSNDFIVSLGFDRRGNLWIGTEDGLSLFDGVDITSFSAMSGLIPGNQINKVLPLRNSDNVWVATQRSGLSCFGYYESDAFFLNMSAGLDTDEITDVEEAPNGKILFSTYTKGVREYDPADGKLRTISINQSGTGVNSLIRCMEIGNDGKIYAARYGGGMVIIDPSTGRQEFYHHEEGNPNSLPSNELADIYKDRDGNIWVGTLRGLALFRPVTKDFRVFSSENSGLPSELIFSILQTSDGRLLVSPDHNGVWELDLDNITENSTFSYMPEMEKYRNVGVHAMAEDKFGNIWFGTYGRGLVLIGKSVGGFHISWPHKDVSSIIMDPKGKVICSLSGEGIGRNGAMVARLPGDNNITSMFSDSMGRIWSATFNGGVGIMDSDYQLLKMLDIREARAFTEYNGDIWIASLAGIYRIDDKTLEIKMTYRDSLPLPDKYLRAIAFDTEDRLWVGSFRSGLFIFDKNFSNCIIFDKEHGFPSNFINHIFMAHDGSVYVATGDGLVRFSPGKTIRPDRIYSEEDGLQSQFVRAITEDNDGTIWFSTNRSICRIDPVDDKLDEFSYHSGIADGIFNSGAVIVGADGYLHFGSTGGMTSFLPSEVTNTGPGPSLHFARISTYDSHNPLVNMKHSRMIAGIGRVDLRWWQSYFDISFVADNPSLSDIVEYSYNLHGNFHGDDYLWIDLQDKTSISFHNLHPGKYVLKVKSRLLNGDWCENPISLEIVVRHPFYSSAFAKAAYLFLFLCLMSAITVLYRKRVKRENDVRMERQSLARMHEENEDRLRFYTNVAHELRTPLTLIVGPAEDLKNSSELSPSNKNKASLISKNASRLLELISQLLDFRKAETKQFSFNPKYGNLSRFVEDVGSVFVESNTKKDVDMKMDIEGGLMMEFDHEILFTILNNLLGNAMKYTDKGMVTLSMHRNGDEITITVSDTGSGISQDDLPKVFDRYYTAHSNNIPGTGIGLSLVKTLSELHNWQVEVTSKKDKGSEFTVHLPSAQATVLADSTSEQTDIHDNQSGKKSIVVVEDNEDILDYISTAMHSEFDVYTATNGLDGLSLARSILPDVVVSDVMMPGMDGMQLCSSIKGDVATSHIIVILLTAKSSIEDREEGYKSGADSFISKPFTTDMLLARIHNLIAARKKLAMEVASGDKTATAKADETLSPIDNDCIRRVTELIENNLQEERLDVGWLAQQMGMSVSTLYRKMKSLLGMSANEYIRKIRLHKAAKLLTSGNCNVSETAWMTGFGSLIHFRQCFKQEFGQSPSEYKKAHTTT